MADQERKHDPRIADSVRKEERRIYYWRKIALIKQGIESYTISSCLKKKERRD
jgi:hypothetical protein